MALASVPDAAILKAQAEEDATRAAAEKQKAGSGGPEPSITDRKINALYDPTKSTSLLPLEGLPIREQRENWVAPLVRTWWSQYSGLGLPTAAVA